MLSWFTNREKLDLHVDIHSHLLPGLDDGVKSLGESLEVIEAMSMMGFRKLITTPHIYPEVYPNNAESILAALDLVRNELAKKQLSIQLEAGAEYYLDSTFLSLISQGEQLLSFGDQKYLLFETSFQNKPMILEEVIFELKTRGYSPVLAHPERYEYLQPRSTLAMRLKELDVKFQVSLPSLKGYYGPEVRKKANTYLKSEMVDFLASDIHRPRQLEGLAKSLDIKVPKNPLLNNTLL